MIAFQDFAPRQGAPGGTVPPGQWETFDQAVLAANTWIQQYSVRVLNIETVVLPNMWNPITRGTLESRLNTSVEMASHWFQFVRVWYEVG